MKFNRSDFKLAINNKIAEIDVETGKGHGSRYYANQIGIAHVTLVRILNGKGMDLDTFAAILTWLKKSPKEFIK